MTNRKIHLQVFCTFSINRYSMLYHYSLLEWLLLYAFSYSVDRSRFLCFLFGMDDSCSGKSFSIPSMYPRSNTLTTSLVVIWWFFICEYIVVFSSFLISCFMNNNTLVVNHQLQLYNIFFLFVWIVCLASFNLGSWYLLFGPFHMVSREMLSKCI